jgi:hypothetical protein
MDSPDAQDISPVFDPLPPAVPAVRSSLMPAAAVCWLASAACISVMAARGASVAWVVAWFTATAAAVAVTRLADFRSSAHHSRRVIEPSSFDGSCRQLLRRAQVAIDAILSSEVYAADLLGHAAGEGALRRHEWEIASTLREITALRAESGVGLPGASRGPMTEAVLESHRRALALAQEATASRVYAIERYAAQVRVTDAARLDCQSALKVAGLNDRYLDLLARTAADELAVAEIASLTEQASAANEAFRENLHLASLAAEALALPAREDICDRMGFQAPALAAGDGSEPG